MVLLRGVSDLPLIGFDGPSRLSGALPEREIARMFAKDFDIERLPEPPRDSHFGCFLLTRRWGPTGVSGC